MLTDGINAQTNKFPVYDNQRISRPVGLPIFRGEDFKININRINQYSSGFLYGNQKTLNKLVDFLLNDPAGHVLWKKETNKVAKVLNQWDFDRKGFGADRYIYNISQLNELSIVYLFTGHKELGQFIRGHVLQIADLPFEFWLHSELRGYKREKPLGQLETASLCNSIAATLSATADLFTTPERVAVENALREKGLKTCLNWLDKPSVNNFTAVISSGAYIAASYLNDNKGKEKALKTLIHYLDRSIESDGSYGEGMGYFGYPIGTLLPVILTMKNNELSEAFSNSGLRNSASWRLYPFLFALDPNRQIQSTILHFGDNSFDGPTSPTVNIILAVLYRDPLAIWLLSKFDSKMDFMDRLLFFSFSERIPEPKSPEQVGLPLIKAFNNGDSFIRSSWKENGIVLAMRSGDGSHINFSHQRAELGSISLGAFGEYMIVSPGSASYRSPLHYQYDYATRSANTITIDDKNQLFPGSGKYKWNTSDISGFWMTGTPKGEIVNSHAGTLADVLVNEIGKAYHTPMKYVRRSVIFVRDPGYFLVVDKIEAPDSLHKYSWRIHLNNRDNRGSLDKINQNHWHFSRPMADLDVFLFSDKKISTKIGQGYMHGTGRDYSPGGVNEGKPGSSIELEAFNPEKLQSLTLYSVLYPTRRGSSSPVVKFSGDKINVGRDVLTFSEGVCTLKKEGQTESYKLW